MKNYTRKKILVSRLWIALGEAQSSLVRLAQKAQRNRKVGRPLSLLLRRIHWIASFLNQHDLADMAMLGAIVVQQEKKQILLPWSTELLSILNSIVEKIKFSKTEPTEGPLLPYRPRKNLLASLSAFDAFPSIDLLAFFRKNHWDSDFFSASQKISLRRGHRDTYTTSLPAFINKYPNDSHELSLVYCDLNTQSIGLSPFIKILERAYHKKEILLHGSLDVSQKNKPDKIPYYFVLDTTMSAMNWIKKSAIQGKPIKIIRRARDQNAVEDPARLKKLPSPDFPVLPKPEEVPTLPLQGRKKSSRLHFSMGLKLTLIISAIVIFSMSSLSYSALFLFKKEIKDRVDQNTISLSKMIASQSEEMLFQFFNSANVLLQITSSDYREELIPMFFSSFPDLLYVGIQGSARKYTNEQWFLSHQITEERTLVENILAAGSDRFDRVRNGETVIFNVSPLIPSIQKSVLAMALPFPIDQQQEVLLLLVDVSSTLAANVLMQEGQSTSMIVNIDGEILAHPELPRVLEGENLSDSLVFQKIYIQGLPQGRIFFDEIIDQEIVSMLGSFALIPTGNLGVVTTVLEKNAFQIASKIQTLNIYLLIIVLSLAILGSYLYVQSFSTPIKDLAFASRRIKAGDLDIKLLPRSHDEIGQLTRAFVEMTLGLQAKERLQKELGSFVNPAVARMAAEGNLPEHGETKEVTVLFSDIRNFTAISERLADPELLLNTLSNYFESMVSCIDQTNGVVDKFIGDAIMAVWGSMQALENSAENAVNAALLMRQALQVFNRDRRGPDKPPLFMGCGLNSGAVTVGIMGPHSKKEWAHMGDSVNLASRIESLNKTMGTDILISESTSALVADIFDLVPMKIIKVKGKTQSQKIYAVLGRFDDENRPKDLNELRRLRGTQQNFKGISV